MATSKTLAPTNVTISIPAMTDQPNASVLANCADKEADAINALNSHFPSNFDQSLINFTASSGFKITRSATSGAFRAIGVILAQNGSRADIFCLFSSSDGTTTCYSMLGNSNYTYTVDSSTNNVNAVGSGSNSCSVWLLRLTGSVDLTLSAN